LAGRLRERGRAAETVAAPGYGGLKDPLLLRSLFADHPDCVLVTADYNMPLNHPLIVDEVGATIATVEPWERRKRIPLVLPEGISADEAWKREVVHRWAHSAATKEAGTVPPVLQSNKWPLETANQNPAATVLQITAVTRVVLPARPRKTRISLYN
jgi:hypothetical protein